MSHQDKIPDSGSIGATSPDAITNQQLEQLLCSRLAGDVLANALFVADAQMRDAIRSGLPPAGRRAIEAAQAAISNAARSGLVLLTVSRPGMEPRDDLDVTTRMRLASRMLQRLDPELPMIDVTAPERLPRARLPIGLLARLLVRVLGCHQDAGHLRIHLDRATGENGIEITIRFEADRSPVGTDLQGIRSLVEPTGGRVGLEGTVIAVSLPALFEVEDAPGASTGFLEGHAPKRPELDPD